MDSSIKLSISNDEALPLLCEASHNAGCLVQCNLSATLATGNDQTLFVPTAFGISSYQSHGMLSDNPKSGFYEAHTARTLDTSGGDPSKHQGGIAIVSEKSPLCYQEKVGALCASDYKFPQQQQIEEGKAVVEKVITYQQTTGPLMANSHPGSYTGQDAYQDMLCADSYTVRRLTPKECALLQGFPADYCDGLETPEPTEDDIAFWTDVWETHRRIMGTSSRPKSRNQIIKWLKNPHSDSAEYKMWGNGISLPIVIFVLGGINYYS